MTPASREATILDRVRQSVEAEGFAVTIEPNSLSLPAFLEGFRPDAVAYGKSKNLIIEVTSQTPSALKRVQKLQEKISGQSGWELRIVWTSAGTAPRTLHRTSATLIEETAQDIETAIRGGHYKAAFLLAWASLEAVGRAILPNELAKPQTPLRIVEQLATRGLLSPDEADDLRELISKRNRLVHGELRVDVRKRDVSSLVDVIRKLTRSITETPTAIQETLPK